MASFVRPRGLQSARDAYAAQNTRLKQHQGTIPLVSNSAP